LVRALGGGFKRPALPEKMWRWAAGILPLGEASAKAPVPRTLSLSRNEAQGQKDRRRSNLNPAPQLCWKCSSPDIS